MADWENIPRLDPALQDEIDNVQLKHNALVKAVRGYSGGSIAGKTNEVMADHNTKLREADSREKTLLSAIGQPEPTPSMLLDFASQTYFTGIRGLEQAVDPHKYLNVSRATPKWVMGPQGKLVEVPPDTLAYEYDPETGEPKGVLIEESRTNITPHGPNFPLNLSSGSTTTTVETVQAEDPFGVTRDVCKFILGNGETGSNYLGYFAFDALDTESGNPVSGSFFFYPDGFNVAQLGIRGSDGMGYVGVTCNLLTGERVANSAAWNIPAEAENIIIERLPNGWVRLGFGAVLGQGTAPGRVEISVSNIGSGVVGDGVKGVLYTCPQFENNAARPSSYIPVTDSPVTRAADNVTRVLGDEFNKSEGTFVFRVSDIDKARGQALLNIMEAGSFSYGPRIQVGMDLSGSVNVACVSDSNGSSNRGFTPATANPVFAISFKSGEPILYSMNGEIATEYVVNPPTNLGLITFSNASGNRDKQMNTSVALTEYYPYAFTETELQELTANG